MDRIKKKKLRRRRLRKSIRRKITGTQERPRLSVYRSNTEIYAQLINDLEGNTLLAASSMDPTLKSEKGTRIEIAKKVGMAIAEKAKEAKIEAVVFDRNGYLYHGRVKALADGAREGGLQF